MPKQGHDYTITPRIVRSSTRQLIGLCSNMSLADYQVTKLWKQFMPRLKEIRKKISSDLISLSIYSSDYFENFSPTNLFEKWAAVEVMNFEHIPQKMGSLTIPAGMYAVFDYKGLNTDNSIYKYIFQTWLPSSGFVLDSRPHFEILGEKYKNNDPESEEEIWVPVKKALS